MTLPPKVIEEIGSGSWQPMCHRKALMKTGAVVFESADLLSLCRVPASSFPALSHETQDVGRHTASATSLELFHRFAFGAELVLIAHLSALQGG